MLVLTLDNFDTQNIYFGSPLKNTIINNGRFYHINYSTKHFSLNTIYLKLPLKMSSVYNNNKMKITFKKKENEFIMDNIKSIEEEILKPIKKSNQFKITQYLENEAIIIHSKPVIDFILILKISGLWETEDQCGLTFKFIIHPLKNKPTQLHLTI